MTKRTEVKQRMAWTKDETREVIWCCMYLILQTALYTPLTVREVWLRHCVPRNMVCFGYISVNTLHKGDDDDDDNVVFIINSNTKFTG
jgi:hypothetical protein